MAPAAVRAIKKLPPEGQAQIRRVLETLADEAAKPGRFGGKASKTIQGIAEVFHRLRVGDYRVMNEVIDEDRVILVLGIVHRGDLERWLRNR